MARADSSWMHNPKHSWQPACVDNLGQPQPNWQAAHHQKCSHLSKGKPGCGVQQEGGGSLPSPACNAILILLLSLLAGGKVPLPKCSPLLPFFRSFASPTRREAQQTGSEHAVGFIWGISQQWCCCLGTLTEPCALPSSCVWGATRPLTKSQQ